MRVRYSRRALNQLDGIHDRIAEYSLQVARKERVLIADALKRLGRSPKLGKATSEVGIRKIILRKGSYAAYYVIKGTIVFVVRILHTKQDQ